jgi:autotransporter-associated beta strand protein
MAAALLASSAGVAQVFVPQGPAPSIGALDVVQSGDAASNGGTVTGAVQSILLDPALGPNTMFLASPNGGIWSTSNGGATWMPLTDKQASLSIASLGLDPTDTSGKTLIAGIGLTSNGLWDAFNRANRAGSGGQQTGLLYSTNGGSTWTPMGSTSPLNGQSVIGVAAVGQTILAATFEPQAPDVATTSGGASYGLYRSVNGGTNFSAVSGALGSGLPTGPVTALVADPGNSGSCGRQNTCTFYASITSPSNPQATGVYISNNSGQSWSAVFTSATAVSGGTNVIAGSTTYQLVPKLAAGPNGSVAIAIAEIQPFPTSSSCVPPASVNCNGQHMTGLYLSQNSGGSWSALAVPVTNAGVRQAVVNLAVAIDPSNTSTVYVAGDGLPVSPFTVPAFRVQGNTATSITDSHTSNSSTAHSDARVLVIDAAGNLLMGSDGGVYMRSNPQSDNGAWTGLNTSTLQIREPSMVAYGANAKRLIFAAQDTGIATQSAPNSALFNAIQGADGVNVAVSDKTFANQSVYYNSFYNYGELSRLILDSQGSRVSPGTAANGVPITCNGGHNCANPVHGVVGQFFSSPFVLNKVDPTRIALAGGHVYVTTDTAPANATSVDLNLLDLGATHGDVYALAYGTTDNPNVVLTGNNNVNGLWLSTTATANSMAPIHGFAGQVPTSVVFDQRSQNRFYVADSISLWGTRNQGTTFQNLSANMSANNIIRPTAVEFINSNGVDALLVGGLSSTANAQSQITVADSDVNGNLSGWRLFGSGNPNALVAQMSYNPLADVLAIGAVGRGVWALYDVTSYFPQATVLQFGLADNGSMPDASFLTNGTSASRPLIKYGSGTLTIAGDATYTGGTTINNGAVVLGAGGASGSIIGNVIFCGNAADPTCNTSSSKTLAFNRSDTYTFGGTISGPGQVLQVGGGTTVLTGTSTYSGSTLVQAGTLLVHGSITSSVSVDNGGTLGGNGEVGGDVNVMAGGTYSPGASVGTHTVHGNLQFSPGSIYHAEILGSTADRIRVDGTAVLSGTVRALFLGGDLTNHYTILTTTGGRTGTFDSLLPLNAPSFMTTSLAYTANAVQLNLQSALGQIGGLSRNQSAVGAALDNSFNSGGGTLPVLLGVAPSRLPAALSMLSGEGVSGTQEAAFGAARMFASIMMDQGAFWRSGDTLDLDGVTLGPLQYAPSETAKTADHPVIKALAAPAPYQPRWRAWFAGFDGTAKLKGEAGIGSAGLAHNTGGLAAGLDYRLAPDMLLGFGIAGSSSNFSVSDRITSGRLEAAHIGGYGVKTWDSLYAAGALSFSTFRNSTTRTIAGIGVSETATGSFGSNLLSGRVEVGSKQAFDWFAVTPFAAAQFAQLWQNGFAETNLIAAGVVGPLGLTFGSARVSSLPTFLGAQLDTRLAFANGMVVSPYGRLSWVHEFNPNRAIDAAFLALPGAGLTVDGPRAARDAARIDAGAKLAFAPNAWLFASFDGEFSSRSQSYAGRGGLKIAW